MCTIITSNDYANRNDIIDQVILDSMYNADGLSMLAILDNGLPFFVKSLDSHVIVTLIGSLKWDRVFIHTRLATAGETSLQNCHGWNSDGTFIFHNGYIGAKVADNFSVDSEAIKYWMDNFGQEETLKLLNREMFANVFLVNLDKGEYHVHRSITGSLYTDGFGNYSTNKFGDITIPVEYNSHEVFELDVINTTDVPEPVSLYSDEYKSSVFEPDLDEWNDDDLKLDDQWTAWEKVKKYNV